MGIGLEDRLRNTRKIAMERYRRVSHEGHLSREMPFSENGRSLKFVKIVGAVRGQRQSNVSWGASGSEKKTVVVKIGCSFSNRFLEECRAAADL
ncbi:hypothetical protein [Litorisediminicola beolgyonensis]|uniref:Uncharacterized protein n=1 Tax=Litorisediminicola beolgyonensis TaxID=1173614 RepID=A0ABW3ZKI9_9RHOB